MTVTDKKTIGVTNANGPVLTDLVVSGRFASELDAAKFAMAFAIKQGIARGVTEGAETKWNVGSIDPDGSVRALLEALYPGVPDPYRLMEHLMNEGLAALKRPGGSGIVHIDQILFP